MLSITTLLFRQSVRVIDLEIGQTGGRFPHGTGVEPGAKEHHLANIRVNLAVEHLVEIPRSNPDEIAHVRKARDDAFCGFSGVVGEEEPDDRIPVEGSCLEILLSSK